MPKKEEKKLTHIQVKDNGLIISSKVGDKLADAKATLENELLKDLIKGSNETNLTRYKIIQNNAKRDFKAKADKLTKKISKEVKTTLNEDKSVNLKAKQVTKITNTIDKGLLFLSNNSVSTYQNTLNSIFLRVKKASDLKEELQRHIDKGLNIGVVYQDGKNYKFDTYFEMNARTEIQVDIKDNMIAAGHDAGIVFYITSFYGDCAKDHADYQGKIYYDAEWKANAPKDRIDEIQNYIDSNKLKTVQEITDAPVYLTSRPNCRHYFQYIDIDSVLGAKNNDDVNKLREERNLNSGGKYQPEKYEALQKQRLNERAIRKEKEDISKLEHELALHPENYKNLQSQILLKEDRVKAYQANQRALVKQFSNLERQYSREQVGNRVTLGLDKYGNDPKQYLMKPEPIGINEKELELASGIKKPSNVFAWRIAENGDIHALKSHDDVPKYVPNWKEKTIEAISKGSPERDLKRPKENVVIYKLPVDDGHFLHVSVLVGKKINYVKSISYRSYKIKKAK